MFFITLTLYATIHLNMTSAIQKDVGGIKNPSSFQIKVSKELESLGLFIFKDKKSNQIIEISGNILNIMQNNRWNSATIQTIHGNL